MHHSISNIGILTWHYYPNFGSALQAFALQCTIESLGYKATLVNYHNPKFGPVSSLRTLVQVFLGNTIGLFWHRFLYAPQCFSYRYHHLSKLTTDVKLLPKLTKKMDVLVCGSDQIWAPNVYNSVYFAAFANKDIRKVSYAASIGLNDIPSDLVPKYKKHLKDFYAIGIREEEGKELLKAKCDIESTVVIDPTLLLDVSIYSKIMRPVRGIKQPYLFCYFLNKEHQYKDTVQAYAHKHRLQVVGVSSNAENDGWMTLLTGLGADHFLWLISHADTIMTDSYHGSIFSLLFHKNFWIFQRFAEDSPICQNSRIRQLCNSFRLGHRIISATLKLDESCPIDYVYFESQLKSLRASSLGFLKQALN